MCLPLLLTLLSNAYFCNQTDQDNWLYMSPFSSYFAVLYLFLKPDAQRLPTMCPPPLLTSLSNTFFCNQTDQDYSLYVSPSPSCFTVWHPFLQPGRPRLLTVCVSLLILLHCLMHMLLWLDAQIPLTVHVTILFLFCCLTHAFATRCTKTTCCMTKTTHCSYFTVWHMFLQPARPRLSTVCVSVLPPSRSLHLVNVWTFRCQLVSHTTYTIVSEVVLCLLIWKTW